MAMGMRMGACGVALAAPELAGWRCGWRRPDARNAKAFCNCMCLSFVCVRREFKNRVRDTSKDETHVILEYGSTFYSQ